MEDVPDESAQLHSILQFYVEEFRQNQECINAHLKGSLSNEPSLLPAFLPPSSYWTSAEKDLFFHALSIYSRLQPELIAQNVKTKSTFDVCVYLEALKRAAELMEDETHRNSAEDSLRAEMEHAMEVSEKWVLREEAIGKSLVALDACPCSLEGPNSKLIDKCICPPAERLNNHLDPICLMVLEMIHKEGETGNRPDDGQPVAAEQQRSSSVLDPQGEILLSSESAQVCSNADLQVLIPGSGPKPDKAQLRRIQKRLYMRRKRADAVGKTPNTEAVKLRPGRQARDRKLPNPRPKKYTPPQHGGENNADDPKTGEGAASSSRRSLSYQPEDSVVEDVNDKHTKGGITRPYKLKKMFNESGITPETLSEMELDFFNLARLGKLLRSNNSLNGASRKGDTNSVSVDYIQLLREMIKEFSSKVIQRAIIMKEQEIRLKASLKVWKYDREEISVENMLHCLKTMGLDQLSKKRYFSDMLDVDSEEDATEEMSLGEESTTSEEQSACESEEETSTSESLPPDFKRSKSSFLPPPSSYLYFDLCSKDNILSSDIDEAALTNELAEEDILDVLDIMRSKEYEKKLWQTHC